MVPTEEHKRQTKRARTEENVIIVDGLVLSQQDRPQIHRSVHQVAQAGIVRIILFHRHLGLKCFQETFAKELAEANRYSRLRCSKQLLIDVVFIWFTDKMLLLFIYLFIYLSSSSTSNGIEVQAKNILLAEWPTQG